MSLASLYTFKVIVIHHQLSADDFHVLLQAAVSLVIAVQRRLLSFFFLGNAVAKQFIAASPASSVLYSVTTSPFLLKFVY